MNVNVAAATRRREQMFHLGMTALIVLTVFAGFARTYYLRPLFDLPPLMPLLHLHGLVFTAWIVIYVAQTALVAADRTRVHRRLGVAGAVCAGLLIVVGIVTAILRAQQGATPPGGPPPLVFLAVPLGDMAVFTTLAGAGLHYRRRPDVHKRLMLLATIGILPAAIARLPFTFIKAGPVAFFGLTDLFVLACLAHDLLTHRRIHRATLWGGLVIVISQPVRLLVGGTPAWIAFWNQVTT